MSAAEVHLAPYAQRSQTSRGRRYPEPEHAFRGCYQRDRDRIIHSAAFRRLMYKTQVLVNDYSDQPRTRLTHTLEVAQISRTLARQLAVNEDLTEAIALAHDLGHPPFGHAGEAVLAEFMRDHGGFEHNRFGLRLVEQLEQRYPEFPGLNLTWEVRASFAYHSKQPNAPEVREYRDPEFPQPFLEAQIVDAADSLAYNAHDLDDALTLGLIRQEELADVRLWHQGAERAKARHGERLTAAHLHPAVVRAMIDWQVEDLLASTRKRLAELRIEQTEQVCRLPNPIVAPSPEMAELIQELEAFLHGRVYRHAEVLRLASAAQECLRRLFRYYVENPAQLPPSTRSDSIYTATCDYLACLTDRAARDDLRRLSRLSEGH